MSAMSDGTTRLRRRATRRSHMSRTRYSTDPRPPGSNHSTTMSPIPLPANWKRNRKRWGTTPANHSVLLRKTAPRIAPGIEPSPPTTTIVSARMLSTGAKMSLPSACWWSTSTPPANDAKKPGQREREQLDAGGAEAERLRVPLVLARRDEVAHVPRPLEPADGDEHEQQREHGHEVEVALGIRAAVADSDVPNGVHCGNRVDAVEEVVG